MRVQIGFKLGLLAVEFFADTSPLVGLLIVNHLRLIFLGLRQRLFLAGLRNRWFVVLKHVLCDFVESILILLLVQCAQPLFVNRQLLLNLVLLVQIHQ